MGGDRLCSRCAPDVSASSAEWSLGAGEAPHPMQTWVLGPPTNIWQPPQPGTKRQTLLGWENSEKNRPQIPQNRVRGWTTELGWAPLLRERLRQKVPPQ